MGKVLHSAGIMVLGMHRSGTSALAHALQLAGADLGSRVLGASAGNERGHWEDAFAVELHERLFSRFGVRWDDVFALPPDWMRSEAAQAARQSIDGYLSGNRSQHALWVVKDPRLSQFGALWRDAGVDLGMPISAIVLARHPLEVADSLGARDGMATGTALLLWAEHMVSALRIAEGMPSVLVGYQQLLTDWRACADRIRRLPGAEGLALETAADDVQASLDAGMRHHSREGEQGLPLEVARIWRHVQALSLQGSIPEGTARTLAPALEQLSDLLHPYAGEVRQERRKLWERIAQAEGQLSPLLQATTQVPVEIQELRARVDSHQDSIINAFSTEVRGMQEAYAAAAQVAARAERDAETARQLGPEIGALRAQLVAGQESVIGAISIDLRRMQEVTAEAVRSAQMSEDRAVSEARKAERSEAELAAVRHQLAGLRIEHAASEQEISGLRATRDALEVRLTNKEHESSILRATRDALEVRLGDSEHENSLLRATRDALQARLADSERETSVLRMEVSRLGELAERLQQVMQSRSWRWTRPLRVLGRLLRGNWTESDSHKLRRGMLGLKARTPLIPSEVKQKHLVQALRDAQDTTPLSHADAKTFALPLAAAGADLPDVFVWAVIDWHFRTQRPQHLARALAGKGHRVFYVSNNFVDEAEPGFSVLPLDEEGRLFQVHLNLSGAPQIYFGMPTRAQLASMAGSLAQVLQWTCTQSSVSIVQHPHWMDLATMVPSARLVYDCMDHHPGFENNASEVLRAEECLVGNADLVVVTSGVLQCEVENRARSTAIIRNAADYEFFRDRPADVFHDDQGRKVIGYYGAIAEWFDVELVRAVASRHADALVLLVGADTIGAGAMLSELPNVRFVGEVKYGELPYWLHGFDVCMLPFKVIPLTIATNPVKVYEYLSAGKPVVSVNLPEMAQFGGLVQIAADEATFVDAIGALLPRKPAAAEIAARQAFAQGQTWAQRAASLDRELRDLQEPLVSVVVLTFNNLDFTKACLSSIEAYSDYRNLEVIVVDNLSSDGTREWLGNWALQPSAVGHTRRLILNDGNAGFAAGNNIGLRAAAGEFIVILNNDTYVTPGWIRTLCAHFRRDAALGLVGPVTNNIGNEAKLDIQYSSMEQMIALAGEHTRAHPGAEISLGTVAFFCVAMPRSVLQAVGELDEAFGVGFFEDDDYCRRVERAGYRIACAEDVFVHHHLSASFGQMPSEEKLALFERNKRTYEAKWGDWKPHAYRDAAKDPDESAKSGA